MVHKNENLDKQISQKHCFFFNNARCSRKDCRFEHEKAQQCKNDGDSAILNSLYANQQKWVGESERQLRLLFDQAFRMRPSGEFSS